MQIADLKIIIKVAQLKSITAAAANLDMHTATASAAVKRVEKSLGAELFIRTTRQLRLSSAGERYIPQCEEALAALEKAQQNIFSDQARISGELRIAISSDLGRNFATDWLNEFLAQHPAVSLRVSISDSTTDLYRESLDMALRYGRPEDASLYGFKICDIPKVLCASPNYLSQIGTLKHPQDLVSCNGLFYQLYDSLHDVWSFHSGNQTLKIKMQGNRASNDGDIVKQWCISGYGVAVKSALETADALINGELVALLPDYPLTPTELWLVCPSRSSITPAVRALRDLFQIKTKAILDDLTRSGVIHS